MYLALRRGREMGAHCAPLRKKKSSAVLLFEAVAGLWSAPDYLGKGVIHKRVETVGVYPLVRPRGVSARSCLIQAKNSPPRQGEPPVRFKCPDYPVPDDLTRKGTRFQDASALRRTALPAHRV